MPVHKTRENSAFLFILFCCLAQCSLVRKSIMEEVGSKYLVYVCVCLLSFWDLTLSCYNIFDIPNDRHLTLQHLSLHSVQLTKAILSFLLSWYQESADRSTIKTPNKRFGLPQWPFLHSQIWFFKFYLTWKYSENFKIKLEFYSGFSVCSQQEYWSAAGNWVKPHKIYCF